MVCHESLVSFLSSLKNYKSLFKETIFAVSILRLLDDLTSALLFELIHSSLHISNIRTIPNIKERINNLLSLQLIKKSGSNVILDTTFRHSLLSAFEGMDLNHRFNRVDSNTKILDAKNIEQITDSKFRSILELIVSNTRTDLFGIKDVLYFCNLTDENGEITNKGFEFLLKPKKDQLWFLALNSITFYSKDNAEENSNLLDLLEIIMKREVCVYSRRNWSSFYSFLDSIGVILLEGKEDNITRFYVDNSSLFSHSELEQKRKFISLETNFKIYAYTSKSYEKSVLSLFSKTVCTFPNLIKALFDEESIIAAFSKGITTKQIIRYLQEYCENVPKNVINQIHIWEQKQHRIRMQNGYLYHDFIHLSDFTSIVRFVELKGSLIYKDEKKRIIVAEEKTHEEVKEFIKKLNNNKI